MADRIITTSKRNQAILSKNTDRTGREILIGRSRVVLWLQLFLVERSVSMGRQEELLALQAVRDRQSDPALRGDRPEVPVRQALQAVRVHPEDQVLLPGRVGPVGLALRAILGQPADPALRAVRVHPVLRAEPGWDPAARGTIRSARMILPEAEAEAVRVREPAVLR